jgi:thiamine pyrophosphate-dependent acetolactate synthase large subunit-like protein
MKKTDDQDLDFLAAVPRDQAAVMNRSDLTRRLKAALHKDEAVIGGIGHTNFDLWASGHRPQNFYMLGSMGLATGIGLGVAIAQPERRTVVLDGDGSLLMQLGSLGTLHASGVKNLVVIIWDNACYQITGSQPTLTSMGVDLVQVASGMGLDKAFWAKDEAHFEALVQRSLTEDGPWFIAARTDHEPPAGVTDRDPSQIRDRFMRGLGVKGVWGENPRTESKAS